MPASTTAVVCGSSGRPRTTYACSSVAHASRVSSPGAIRGVETSRTRRPLSEARLRRGYEAGVVAGVDGVDEGLIQLGDDGPMAK
jgi:hypothetical protein